MERLMTRFLIVLGVTFAGLVAICGAGFVYFAHALMQADPYPTFMTDHQLKSPHSYEEAADRFSEFIAKAFPIGSDAKDAIAQIKRGGFQVSTSSSESVELLWRRHNGPCSEQYSIVVNQTAGAISKITGRLHPICL
jgi:hypothetical protein